MHIIERTLTHHIQRIANYFPVILLTGPRQVGKTTILEAVSENHFNYVSLDDMNERALAKQDPALFIQNHHPPVMIDEVQYAPELFTAIKIYVDSHKGENGLFYLTGSQKFGLMQGIQESLAGRVAVIDVLGFSNNEISKRPQTKPFLPTPEWLNTARQQKMPPESVQDIFTKIWAGSFPRLVCQNNHERELFYRSYIQTYIERDVKDAYHITDSICFFNFIRAIAARTGQILNYTDIARDVAIDAKTAKIWLSIMERSGLVKLLYPYYNNITNRIIKAPKLYFLDTGLCAYLTGWDTPQILEAGAMSGAILETYAFIEILKSYWHNGKEPLLYFYRDKEKKEIDFILENNGTLYPVEVKKTLTPNESAVKNFDILAKLNKPIGPGVILCLKPEVFSLTRTITAVPLWMI